MVTRADCLTSLSALEEHLRATLAPSPYPVTDAESLAARSAAVLLPLHADAQGRPYLLFTVRSSELPQHRGEISFPGGKPEPADSSFAATALREANEEIGLHQSDALCIGYLPSIFTVVSNYLITPVVATITGTAATIAPAINQREVAAILDVPLIHLDDPSIRTTRIFTRDGRQRTVYFYQYGEYSIWGATGAIVTEFLSFLPRT